MITAYSFLNFIFIFFSILSKYHINIPYQHQSFFSLAKEANIFFTPAFSKSTVTS